MPSLAAGLPPDRTSNGARRSENRSMTKLENDDRADCLPPASPMMGTRECGTFRIVSHGIHLTE